MVTLSAFRATTAPPGVRSSFKATAMLASVWLPLSLASAGVSAESLPPSAPEGNIEMHSAQNLLESELEQGDYRPLVQRAFLFSGLNGPALDLLMDEVAAVNCILSASGRMASAADGDTHFRYDLTPEQDSVGVLRLGSGGTELFSLLTVSGNVAYAPDGGLVNVDLPESLHYSQGIQLGATLEALLKVLANDEAQLLRRLGGQEHALLNLSADQASLTVYSDSDPVRELFRVEIDRDDHYQIAVLDPDWLESSEVYNGASYRGGAFKLAVVMENYKGSVSSVAMNYLKDVVSGFDEEELKTHVGELGQVGESGLNPPPVYDRPGWNAHFPALPVNQHQVYLLKGTSNPEEILKAVRGILARMGSIDIQPVIAVDDSVFSELQRAWCSSCNSAPINRLGGVRRSDLFTRNILVPVSRLRSGVDPYLISYRSSGWLIHYLSDQSLAVFGGMAIGGAVQTGLDIYTEYQKSGRLPDQYTEQESKTLKKRVLSGVKRGGISAAASFNLTRGLGVSSVVAGAVVGAGNSLYDSYRQGRLLDGDVGSTLLRAGAASAVASAGSVVGAGIGSMVPLPLSRTAGALAGSLAGHYIYSYIEDSYQSIKDAIENARFIGLENDLVYEI